MQPYAYFAVKSNSVGDFTGASGASGSTGPSGSNGATGGHRSQSSLLMSTFDQPYNGELHAGVSGASGSAGATGAPAFQELSMRPPA